MCGSEVGQMSQIVGGHLSSRSAENINSGAFAPLEAMEMTDLGANAPK